MQYDFGGLPTVPQYIIFHILQFLMPHKKPLPIRTAMKRRCAINLLLPHRVLVDTHHRVAEILTVELEKPSKGGWMNVRS